MAIADIISLPDFKSWEESFEEKYYQVDYIINRNPDFRKPGKGKKAIEGRICRFCGGDHTQKKFVRDAHLVSKYLGNTTLFSSFECDECNEKFGKVESDLANYMGLSRSILGLSDISQAPGLVAKRLKVKSRSFYGHNILILSKQDINEVNTPEERKSGIIKIPYTKPPYVPSNVFKGLLKAAFSILPEDEVKNN